MSLFRTRTIITAVDTFIEQRDGIICRCLRGFQERHNCGRCMFRTKRLNYISLIGRLSGAALLFGVFLFV